MPRLKVRRINNTWCPECGCTFMVDGDDGPATIEEMEGSDMSCPCCEDGRLAHVKAE